MSVPVDHPERQAVYAARRREWTCKVRAQIDAFHEAGSAELRAAGVDASDTDAVAAYRARMAGRSTSAFVGGRPLAETVAE